MKCASNRTSGAKRTRGSQELAVDSNTLTRLLVLANDPKRSDMDFINTGGGGDTGGGGGFPGCNLMPCAITVQGLPFVKTLDAVTNHPMLKGVTIPRTGRIGPIGTLTTKTLVISGERGFTTLPSGQRFAKLYAYDKATGRELANVSMPAPQTGSPMSYMLNGTQYLVVAISGPEFPAELIAYTVAP